MKLRHLITPYKRAKTKTKIIASSIGNPGGGGPEGGGGGGP
ncbi:hypothetical protein [Pontimicrobium sp. SW4]|uniref:Uncharacterized protein n=1 Tax=Pontimicrobium sp. SW4 TaxID=3153519 RepID=A0AAU7BSC5_9FLAO